MITCEITFDPIRIDFVAAAHVLSKTYWGKGRTEGGQITAFSNSICAGAILDGKQVGFGRVITDRVYSAHLCDVIVLPDWRGQGVGGQIIRAFLDHPELAKVEAWSLNTADAHELYEKFGFERIADGKAMRLSRRI